MALKGNTELFGSWFIYYVLYCFNFCPEKDIDWVQT